jgi:hypothetical protein
MFFVYALELPEDFDFDVRSEMHPFPVPELLAIRANQALRSAVALCGQPGIPRRVWSRAAEIVALNLKLHDFKELAQRMRELPYDGDNERQVLLGMVDDLLKNSVCTRPSMGQEIEILGLSGWQYREFFDVLLPQYANFGVQSAADVLSRFEQDDDWQATRARLTELYQDEDLVKEIPIEL